MKNVLFVRSRNRLRSPTAEQVFSARTNMACSSAGLSHDAENPLTPEQLRWTDIVFVMEKAQAGKLRSMFKADLARARVICLDIPDEYDYMDPQLVRLLEFKVTRLLPAGEVR